MFYLFYRLFNLSYRGCLPRTILSGFRCIACSTISRMLDLLIIPGASPGLIRISIEENRSYRILITRPIPRTPNSIILWDSLLIYSY